jgi:hypothetical protein
MGGGGVVPRCRNGGDEGNGEGKDESEHRSQMYLGCLIVRERDNEENGRNWIQGKAERKKG